MTSQKQITGWWLPDARVGKWEQWVGQSGEKIQLIFLK